jgi:hypothetical protein
MLTGNTFEMPTDASAAERQAVIDRVNAAADGNMMAFEPVQIPPDSSMAAVAETGTPIFVGVRSNSQLDFFVNIKGAHYAVVMPPEIARQVASILIETSIKAEVGTSHQAAADASRTHVALFMACRERSANAADALQMHGRMLQEAAAFQDVADMETQMQLLGTLFENRNQVYPHPA